MVYFLWFYIFKPTSIFLKNFANINVLIYSFIYGFSVVWQVAELLGLDPYEFTIALTQKQMNLRGEQISTPLNVQQVSTVHSLCLVKANY